MDINLVDENIFNENLSGTIFENIDDLPIMTFIDKKLKGNNIDLSNYSDDTLDTIFNIKDYSIHETKTYIEKEYDKFVTKRLREYINFRSGADIKLLHQLVIMEWNHYCKLRCLT